MYSEACTRACCRFVIGLAFGYATDAMQLDDVHAWNNKHMDKVCISVSRDLPG